VPRPISYGSHVSDDNDLRLCGDPAGKRALELGISDGLNAVALAERGAKAIAVDPDPERIARERTEAERAGVRIEFHHGDVADLGFATSGSIDLVIAAGTLVDVDDLPRALRQVHRVLKPECALLVAVPHPVATMLAGGELTSRRPYGTPPGRSVSDLFMALHRTNFRVDNIQELFSIDEPSPTVPSVLLLRARKLGV
jgi:ubiquinone/menaquinone biosynthesis C-methylase UbiE